MILLLALVVFGGQHAFASPSVSRTKMALAADRAVALLTDLPRSPAEARMYSAYFALDGAFRAWSVSRPGPRRWGADGALTAAEAEWFSAVKEQVNDGPACVSLEWEAERAIIDRGVPRMTGRVREFAWCSTFTGRCEAPPPGAIGRLAGAAVAALAMTHRPRGEVLEQLKLSLGVWREDDPWLRRRYAELLGDEDPRAVEVSRDALSGVTEPCARMGLLWIVASNKTADAPERVEALEEVERLAGDFLAARPDDWAASSALERAVALRRWLTSPHRGAGSRGVHRWPR